MYLYSHLYLFLYLYFFVYTASVLEIRGIKSEMVTFNEDSSVSPVSVPVTPYPHFPHFLTYQDSNSTTKNIGLV